MCRSIFGTLNSDVDDLRPIHAHLLGVDVATRRLDQIILASILNGIEEVEAGIEHDAIRNNLLEVLGDMVFCIGSTCLFTFSEWERLMILDLNERKLWMVHKSLAKMVNHVDWPGAVDLVIGSQIPEWPEITFSNPGFEAEVWWACRVLNEGV
ncbi:hypothetical protein RRF57_013241 [Xylaria bambusicola]|uniref:Uncharacterized protein n=1 Tax=Xylaria bambusicola TaxID=326684 RepID=A0AAN7V1F7_9PEZI